MKRSGVLTASLAVAGVLLSSVFVTGMVHAYAIRFGSVKDVFVIAGQVGDSFGAVNALFSGIALCGIFYVLRKEQSERTAERKARLTLDFFINHKSKEFSDSLVSAYIALRPAAPGLLRGDKVAIIHMLQYLAAFRLMAQGEQLDLPLARSMNRSLGEWLAVLEKSLEQERARQLDPPSERMKYLEAAVDDLRGICKCLGQTDAA